MTLTKHGCCRVFGLDVAAAGAESGNAGRRSTSSLPAIPDTWARRRTPGAAAAIPGQAAHDGGNVVRGP